MGLFSQTVKEVNEIEDLTDRESAFDGLIYLYQSMVSILDVEYETEASMKLAKERLVELVNLRDATRTCRKKTEEQS